MNRSQLSGAIKTVTRIDHELQELEAALHRHEGETKGPPVTYSLYARNAIGNAQSSLMLARWLIEDMVRAE